MVSANENMGMPFAIVVNLEDFSVRFPPLLPLNIYQVYVACLRQAKA